MIVNHVKSNNMEEMLMAYFSSADPVVHSVLVKSYTDECIEGAVKLGKIRVYGADQYGEIRYIRNNNK